MFTVSQEFEKFLEGFIERKFNEVLNKQSPPRKKVKESDTTGYKTKRQICEHYGISLSNLNNKLKEGKIKKRKFGSRVLINPNEVESALA